MTAPVKTHEDAAREYAKRLAAHWFPYSPVNRKAAESDLFLAFREWWNAGFKSGLDHEVVPAEDLAAATEAAPTSATKPMREWIARIYRDGMSPADAFHDAVSMWDETTPKTSPLNAYLGLSWDEYDACAASPGRIAEAAAMVLAREGGAP